MSYVLNHVWVYSDLNSSLGTLGLPTGVHATYFFVATQVVKSSREP